MDSNISIQTYMNLSDNSKAAWCSCSLFAQMIAQRAGFSGLKHELVQHVGSIGFALSSPFGLQNWIGINGVEVLDTIADLCEAYKMGQDEEQEDESLGLTEQEYRLFVDVITSNLFYDVKYAYTSGESPAEGHNGEDEDENEESMFCTIKYDRDNSKMVISGAGHSMNIPIYDGTIFNHIVHSINAISYPKYVPSVDWTMTYSLWIDGTRGTFSPLADKHYDRNYTDRLVPGFFKIMDADGVNVSALKVSGSTVEYFVIYCSIHDDEWITEHGLFLIPAAEMAKMEIGAEAMKKVF